MASEATVGAGVGGAPAIAAAATTDGIGRLRGRFHDFYIDGPLGGDPTPLMPTYHPAFLLRRPEFKRECWQDIQLAMAELDPGTRHASG